MPMLTLNEIRSRARDFARAWKGAWQESAEKQTFWNDFFRVFGIDRRRYASYEVPVTLREGKHGKIDLFWPGMLLVEHKTTGQDLKAAFQQAADYFHGIKDRDLPKIVIVSDFARFRVYSTDDGKYVEFPLESLFDHITSFGLLTGHTVRPYEDAPGVSVEAAELMASLHRALFENGYKGDELALLLVRLMFCFFADKTGIFPRDLFRQIIELKTSEDGRDVGPLLIEIFEQLNLPREQRQRNLDPDLKELEYVNGHLFEKRIPAPAFDRKARSLFLRCLAFDWSAVSPAVFGAMFQGVMDEEPGKRRNIGAHYTSEKNILKAIGPLVIEPLRVKLTKASTEKAVEEVLTQIGSTKVLDPACGCGNFLVIAYRELRQLEIDAFLKLQRLKKSQQRLLSVEFAKRIDVDAMYGIEIESFPCRVAETALYIMDHMMNNVAEEKIGPNFRRLPLRKAPQITNGNALRIDWSQVVSVSKLSAVVGNPPFRGKKARNEQQSEDMEIVFGSWSKHAELDYVAAWYVKALSYVKDSEVPVTFVSTNSITQGEQVSILWPTLIRGGLRIHFAHRTFKWTNEASRKAAGHCVIVGWALSEPRQRYLFDYEKPTGDPLLRKVAKINPYLVDSDDVYISSRRTPLCESPKCTFGSMPNDDGNFLFSADEYHSFVKEEPNSKALFRPILSSDQFLDGRERWCLWLKDVPPAVIRALPCVKERVANVREFRAQSTRPATQRLALTPTLFGEIRQPSQSYILIPRHSSELREYIPLAHFGPINIASDSCLAVHSSDFFHFGVLQSRMHMAWVRQVCGRIKSDFRYSIEIVYNNFPWPVSASPAQMQRVRKAAKAVLKARSAIANQSMADLYDAEVMPPRLRAAHKKLDVAVDRCYGNRRFGADLARVKFLFELYTSLAQ